jgi:hypothetical protein
LAGSSFRVKLGGREDFSRKLDGSGSANSSERGNAGRSRLGEAGYEAGAETETIDESRDDDEVIRGRKAG